MSDLPHKPGLAALDADVHDAGGIDIEDAQAQIATRRGLQLHRGLAVAGPRGAESTCLGSALRLG